MRSNYREQRFGSTEKSKKNWKINRTSKAKLQLEKVKLPLRIIEENLRAVKKVKNVKVYYWVTMRKSEVTIGNNRKKLKEIENWKFTIKLRMQKGKLLLGIIEKN